MRALCFSDLHLRASSPHRRDHLADTSRILGRIAGLAVGRDADLVLFAGDAFHFWKPEPAALHLFRAFVDSLSVAGIPAVAVTGNQPHDIGNADDPSALELFASDTFHVSRRPEVIDVAGVQVVTLPSTPVHRLVAAQGGGDRDETNELAATLLIETARDLVAKCDRSRPVVLLVHWSVSGATLPSGLPVDSLAEVVLPLEEIEALGVDAAVFGHIHRPQVIESKPFGATSPSFYCGSPMTLDFGEAACEHGVWLHDLGAPSHVSPEFVPLPGRPFVTVDVDLPTLRDTTTGFLGMTETDVIAAHIAEKRTLTDAVLRVRYRATEEQHRRVDHAALHRLVEDAGVHRLYGGFHWDPVRTQRVRAEGLDESLDHADAVRAWCDANDVDDDQAEALLALTREWVAVGEAVTA